MSLRTLGCALCVLAASAAVAACSGAAPAAPPAPPAASSAPMPAPGGSLAIPRIPVERQDEAFRRALAQRSLTVGATPEETRRYGRTVCEQLDSGRPVDRLVSDVQAGTGFPPADVGYVIGAASACYCPQNLSKLPTG